MAKKKMIYEARKISKEKWGLFIKGTDICYGVSIGKCAKENAKLSEKRINDSCQNEEIEKEEEKSEDL